jgi:hypothetical protein
MEFDDPETALREARQRFIDSFDEICGSVLRAFREGPAAIRVSRGRVHRLAGLAGAVELMRGAFAEDLNAPAPPWA